METENKNYTLETKYKNSVPVYLLLSLVTCGLFGIYWNYIIMQACNDLLEKKEFDFISWFFLTIITCGIFNLYYKYKLGRAITEIQQAKGKPPFYNLPTISLLVTILDFGIVVNCIHQNEINKLVCA